VALAALCISGWCAFGYGHWSFATAERDRLAEIAATAGEREQFRGELDELRHLTGDLRAVQDKLAAAREELRLSTAAREKALAQLSGFQRELGVVSSRLNKAKERVIVTGGIRKIEAPTRAR
jgi:chromosome segregation ATPase